MKREIRRGIVVALAVMSMSGAFPTAEQPERFQEPVPEKTVDPVISPLVYQGGTVVLRVTVAKSGAVERVEVVRPYPALSDPVVAAVQQWRFKPALRNGQIVEATTTVAVHVVLMRTVLPH